MIDAAPALAALALLAVTLLAVAGIVVLALRRRDEPLYEPLPAAPEDAPAAPVEDPAEAALTHERTHRLARALSDERALRNAVLREALARGETAHVASWVRELGDFLLEDLRGDPALAPRLAELASEVVRAGRASPATRALALLELEGRVIAARLSRANESVDEAFLFLEGVQPDRFAAACRELPASSLEVALRFCPARLREAALPQLQSEQREQLALAWARRPTLPPSVALAVAAELRARLAESAGGPSQTERMLAELLDALPRAQQDALVERLRREGDARVLRGLLTESALAGAPREVLAAALLAVAPGRLVALLGGCDAALREHLLAVCPARLQAELRDELRAPPQGREQFLAARREVLARLREEAARAGLSLADLSPAPGERPRLLSTAS
jgi:hypothetical protein